MDRKVIYFGRDLIESGEDFVMAKIVDSHGSAPRKRGAWLLMKKDGSKIGTVGGGLVEAETEKLMKEVFETKQSFIHHFVLNPNVQGGLDMRCGGNVDVSIEYVNASDPKSFNEDFGLSDKALIFGAGHVGLAIEPLLRYVDFVTYIFDDREEYANSERFPESEKVTVIRDFEHAFEGVETDETSYIVIVTRGHMGDYQVLKDALVRTSAYIGMIGSRGKVATLKKMLLKDGFTEDDFKRVHTPIGLDIKAETPEEIGISVVAEMIMVRAEHGEKS